MKQNGLKKKNMMSGYMGGGGYNDAKSSYEFYVS